MHGELRIVSRLWTNRHLGSSQKSPLHLGGRGPFPRNTPPWGPPPPPQEQQEQEQQQQEQQRQQQQQEQQGGLLRA